MGRRKNEELAKDRKVVVCGKCGHVMIAETSRAKAYLVTPPIPMDHPAIPISALNTEAGKFYIDGHGEPFSQHGYIAKWGIDPAVMLTKKAEAEKKK